MSHLPIDVKKYHAQIRYPENTPIDKERIVQHLKEKLAYDIMQDMEIEVDRNYMGESIYTCSIGISAVREVKQQEMPHYMPPTPPKRYTIYGKQIRSKLWAQ